MVELTKNMLKKMTKNQLGELINSMEMPVRGSPSQPDAPGDIDKKLKEDIENNRMVLMKKMVRLYIDVCGQDDDSQYDLANKMSSLLQRKIATYSNDIGLKTGSFHPLDKTPNYYEYKKLLDNLTEKKKNSENCEKLLEEMSEKYHKIPYEEQEMLRKEGISYPLECEEPKELPPTRFKVGQIIKSEPDIWEILEIKKKDTKMRIKVLEKGEDKRGSIGSYLNKGGQYTLYRHKWDVGYGSETWEIPPEKMKRSDSQVLLIWFSDDSEPCIDLDS